MQETPAVPYEDLNPLKSPDHFGFLVKPTTNQKWPICAYTQDGELSLMGLYHEFSSTLEKAVRSGYVLDSDCSELVNLFLTARRAYAAPAPAPVPSEGTVPESGEDPAVA
ncbi:hypothetical protein A6M27_16620 [Acidithiobacillus thiooxidans]|uniref:Uncharacterized protein n=1 Tax=Acidithiobacillus thiooxidans TaxID=930 RepID=A0A1C2JC30_ACITH|nr:hypothetical protein [Acidithiobacillus thiooxidans]OCX67699.1 hypothetical protein A6O24_20575 [Acidithiobacillus thiooxidans]OCX67809.1 hypothetical protein A6P07_19310 [Acidithiobacillus thiooxidans]OCX84148.1 hypothetical protein A6M27_16620 [Acidithiobacillus thiooxidans]OCX85791.1 hypothetical protein A6O26_00155 [Acidithiobacillus thiooxidans]OFC48524.1 hypothetical protein BAE47_07465 [Acidithiobacillus thiooxidans]